MVIFTCNNPYTIPITGSGAPNTPQNSYENFLENINFSFDFMPSIIFYEGGNTEGFSNCIF